MADINVDVQLPAPINVDVTSPTQSVNTNVYVPGPQGPAGPIGPSGVAGPQGPSGAQGNPTEINGLTGSVINLTGVDGNIVYTDGLNLIYISGNSGYFENQLNTLTNNLISTGDILNTNLVATGNILTTNLSVTGNILENNINNLSGYVNYQDNTINLSINELSGLFTGFTGSLDTSYATDADLIATGNTLNLKIDTLSGYTNTIFSTKTDTETTGSLLNSKINTLSGLSVLLTGNQIISGNKNFNGAITVNSISGTTTFNSLNLAAANGLYGGVINLNAGSGIIGPGSININSGPRAGMDPNNGSVFLNGSLVAVNLNTNSYARNFTVYKTGVGGPLENFKVSQNSVNINNTLTISGVPVTPSSYAVSGDAVLVYGDQAISGNKTFVDSISVSGTGTFNALDLDNVNSLLLSGTNINITGNSILNIYNPVKISGNEVLTGVDLSSYALNSNLISTGQNLSNLITSLSGTLTGDYVTKTNGQFINRPFVNGTGVLLSGEIAELPNTIVYTTGDQIISGNKIFVDNLEIQGTGIFNNIDLTMSDYLFDGVNIEIINSTVNVSGDIFISGNKVLTGVDLSSYATNTNLALTGSTLQTNINDLSGYSNNTFATIINLNSTGNILENSINLLSGTLTSTYATINNLESTGNTLDAKINNLSGSSVLLYGNQTIDGVKTFRDAVYIHDLYVTGAEFIATTENNFIQSPYLLLNLTGGAFDGGIFFVTGSGLTGINDTGPIIGFDHSNKFKFGISSRASDLSTLNDIAAFQDITAYSGFVDGKYATIINLASTGSTLENNINTVSSNLITTGNTLENSINSLSGYSNSTFATITNLASTGSTLQTNINTVSSNLVTTGNALEGKISSLSGTLTSTYATISNLASTGSTLNTKIDNLSGYINSTSSNIVFTTGNQTIDGNKNFNGNINLTGTNNRIGKSDYIETDSDFVYIRKSDTTPVFSSEEYLLYDIAGQSSVAWSDRRLNDSLTVQALDWGNRTLNNENGTAVLYWTGSNIGIGIDNPLEKLHVSGGNLRVDGNIYLSGNPVLTGVDLSSYATNTNLASTGSTLQTNIDNLSGVSVLTFGNQLINGTKTFNSGVVINVQPTGTNPALYITGIWNNASQVYTGIALDITNTNSNSNSLLMDLKLGGSSLFAFQRDGFIALGQNAGFIVPGVFLVKGAGGGETFRAGANQCTITSSSPFAWTNSTSSADSSLRDLFLFRDAAGILAQRNSTNPQQFRVYNSTGTNSGEFGLVGWINSGLVIGSQQSQSGILRNVTITGANINITPSGNILITAPTNNTVALGNVNNGFGMNSDGIPSIRINAFERFSVGADGITLSNDPSPRIAFSAGAGFQNDLVIRRDAADILAQRRGTNPQQFRVYNATGTNSGEFGLVGWINSGLVIGPQQTNLGTLRDLTLTGNNININASGLFNIFDTTNIVGDLNVTGNILISGNPILTGIDLSSYATSSNLALTGSTLNTKIDILSGDSVLKYGDQLISGNKTLSGSFKVGGGGHENSALSVRRIDGISKVLNLRDIAGENTFFVEGDVGTDLLIKMGDVDGAYNDAYLSFDQNNALCKIENANLEVNGNIYLSGNPVLTGTTLAQTGANLQNQINSLSGSLNSTGSNLQTSINNLSGYINSTSSNIVFTTGNQNISGYKSFNQGLIVGTEQGGYVTNGVGHMMQIVSDGVNRSPLVLIGGNGANEIWKDTTPTKAVSFGMATPASPITNDLIYSRYDGSSWDETLRIQTSDGQVQIGNNLSFSNNSALKLGTLELQPYSVNNAWFGDNTYYNGAFYRRSAGYAGAFYFQGPEGQFRFADTDSAGTTYTPYVQLKIHLDGRFGVGSIISTATDDFSNSNFFVDSTDNGAKVGIGTITPSEKLEVNGDIKFGESGTQSATLYMYDSPNDVYNTVYWSDSELQLTQINGSSNLSIQFSSNSNALVSNGSILKLPTGKNDFIAMDNEVVHRTGIETISGTKTFASRPTVNGTGVLLSGEAAQVDLSTTVRTTGDQTVSGIKNFQSIPEVSGKGIYYQKDVYYFTGDNFTPDSNLARTFEYVLTGNAGASATLNAPINMYDGENIVIKIKQSASGSNNMQFNASYKFPGSVIPSLTLTAGKADIYTVLKVGTGFYSTYVKDFID